MRLGRTWVVYKIVYSNNTRPGSASNREYFPVEYFPPLLAALLSTVCEGARMKMRMAQAGLPLAGTYGLYGGSRMETLNEKLPRVRREPAPVVLRPRFEHT